LLFSLATSSFGWSSDGHKTVAEIAQNLLKPETLKAINTWTGNKALSTIAMQADYWNASWSAPMHYININASFTTFDPLRDCKDLCVYKAILNYTERLRTATPSSVPNPSGEPSPLALVVHFVGDLHQPLHVGYPSDKGGTRASVLFYNKSTNLHFVWDDDIFQKLLAKDSLTWYSFALKKATILRSMASVGSIPSDAEVSAWAMESYTYVRTIVYQYPDIQSNASLPFLGDKYTAVASPVIEQRLQVAGQRLAAILNGIYSPEPKSHGLSVPVIVAIVIACVAFVLIVILATVIILRRLRSREAGDGIPYSKLAPIRV